MPDAEDPLIESEVDAPEYAQVSYGELVKNFVLMGWTAFGGPSAHIALFETVRSRISNFLHSRRSCTARCRRILRTCTRWRVHRHSKRMQHSRYRLSGPFRHRSSLYFARCRPSFRSASG